MTLPLLAILAAGQMAYGAIKAGKATNDFNAASKDRKAFQTPEELYKILNATQSNAQTGYDPATLKYLTDNTSNAFAGGLETTQRLGGDPNDASALFQQQIDNIFKISGQNHAMRLENFSKFLGALDSVGNSKAAEWASQQDIVKDKMQASNANKQAAFANIQSGINTGIAAYAQNQADNLYNDDNTGGGVRRSVTGRGSGAISIGGLDPTAPPTSIIKNGRKTTWNPFTQKYE